MKEVLPLNADEQGLCRPIKAQYYKNGRANFLKSDGGSFAATGVIEFDMSEIKYIGQMSSSQNSRVIDPEGISYAVTNGEKDGEPKIIERDTPMKGNYTEPKDLLVAEPLRIPQATKQGYVEVQPGGLFDMSYPESKTRRGRVQEGETVSPILMASGDAPCLFEGVEFKGMKIKEGDGLYLGTSDKFFRGGLEGVSRALKANVNDAGCVQNYRIRKLTPKECFRLMGVSETDIDKIQNSGVSQSQQYKMAGNSIVVDVLEHIFRKMFVETEQESQQLSLF